MLKIVVIGDQLTYLEAPSFIILIALIPTDQPACLKKLN